MRRAWAWWVAHLSKKETGEVLALVRVGTGVVLLGVMWSIIGSGIVEAVWLDEADGGVGKVHATDWVIRALGGPTPDAIWLACWLCTAASGLLILGLGGRLTAAVALLTWTALVGLRPDSRGSGDLLVSNVLWLLVLADSTRTWSLDCWIRSRSFRSDARVSSWPRYLMALQVVLLFGAAGWAKLAVEWTPFGGHSALYYTLQNPMFTRFDYTWTASVYPLLQVAGASVWYWELLTPIWLTAAFWFLQTPDREGGRLRRLHGRWDLRVLWVVLGFPMSVGVHALLSVGPFHVALPLFLSLFSAAEIQRVICSRE